MRKIIHLIIVLHIIPSINLFGQKSEINFPPVRIPSNFYTLSSSEQQEAFNRSVVLPAVKTMELDLLRGIQQQNKDIEFYYQQIRDFGDTEQYNQLIADARKEVNNNIKDIRALKFSSLSLSSNTSTRLQDLIRENGKKFQQSTRIDYRTFKNLNDNNPITKKFTPSPLFSPLEKLSELSRETERQRSKQKTNIHEGWGKAWENLKQKVSDFFSIKTPSFEKKPTLWQKIQERRPAIKMPQYYAPTWQKTRERAEKSSIPKYLPQPQKKDSWIKALERQERFGLTR